MRCYGEVWYEGRVTLSAPCDHESWLDPAVAAFCESKIAKVAPAFYKMVQDDDVEVWFKIQMQVWMLQYLIRDSRSPTVPSLMHMTLKFSRRACLTRAGYRTSTTWRSLRSLLLAFTSSASSTFSRPRLSIRTYFVEVNLQDSSSAPHPLSDADDGSLVGR